MEVSFVSFTKKAVNELISRSLKKFKEFDESEFNNFRTIHSMCYEQFSKTGQKVIQQNQLQEIK